MKCHIGAYLTEESADFITDAVLLQLFVYETVQEARRFLRLSLFGCLPCSPRYNIHINQRVNHQEKITARNGDVI